MKPYCPSTQKQPAVNGRFRNFLWPAAVLLIVLSAAFSYALYKAPFFKIKDFEVSGTEIYPAEELLASLKDFLVSGSTLSSVLGADNIFSWNFKSEKFLEKNPQYEQVLIGRDYFERRVKVQVKEREKFGLWCLEKSAESVIENGATSTAETAGGNQISGCFWFDRNGIAFADAPAVEGELLNRVKDKTGRELELGDDVLQKEYFSNVLKIFKILESADLKTKTVRLDSVELAEASVEYFNSPKIYFSLKSDPEFSLAVIRELKKSGQWPKLNYVDFRVENRAYYK